VKLRSLLKKKLPLIEEKAYRDTWGRGLASYVEMLCERFQLLRDLLAESGMVYVHIGWDVAHYVKIIFDEVFGSDRLINHRSYGRDRQLTAMLGKHLSILAAFMTAFCFTQGRNLIHGTSYIPHTMKNT
jgi:hypothetical protein